MEHWFRPMGLNLRVLTNTPKLAAAVCDAYDLFGAGDAASAADLQFEFAQIADNFTGPLYYRMSPNSAELRMGEKVVLESAGAVARGCFPEKFMDARSSFRLHALHFALSTALSSQGFLGVHAACVALDGHAVLLRGPHGAGKSVLAYLAASRGFQVVAGSTVWITPDDNAWCGVPRWIYLRESAQALFPQIIAGPRIRIGDEVRIELDLAHLYVGHSVPSFGPGISVYVERDSNQELSLKPVHQAEARLLWRQGEAGNEATAPNYDTRISRVLKVPSYRLNSANDIHRALDLITAAAQDQAKC